MEFDACCAELREELTSDVSDEYAAIASTAGGLIGTGIGGLIGLYLGAQFTGGLAATHTSMTGASLGAGIGSGVGRVIFTPLVSYLAPRLRPDMVMSDEEVVLSSSRLFLDSFGYAPTNLTFEEAYKVYDSLFNYITPGLIDRGLEPFKAIDELSPDLARQQASILANSPFLFPQMLMSEDQIRDGSLLDMVSADPMLIDDLAISGAFTSTLRALIASEELRVLLAEQIFSVATAEDSVIAESINSLVDQRMSNYGFQAPVEDEVGDGTVVAPVEPTIPLDATATEENGDMTITYLNNTITLIGNRLAEQINRIDSIESRLDGLESNRISREPQSSDELAGFV